MPGAMYPPGHPGNPTDLGLLRQNLSQTMTSGGGVGDALDQFGGDLSALAGQAGTTAANMGQEFMGDVGGQVGNYADTLFDQAQSTYGQVPGMMDQAGQMMNEVEAYSTGILDQIATAPGEVQNRLKEALRGWFFEDTGGLPVNVNVRQPGGFTVTP